jgi:C-terminal processing protease CtpA/Prc
MVVRPLRLMRSLAQVLVAFALWSCEGKTLQAYPDELAGVGIVVKAAPEGHTVAKVIADGPAASAGIEEGDRLLAINGISTTGKPLASVVDLLRGKAGTSVVVRTNGKHGEVTATLTRRLLARNGSSDYHAN